jgi:hypothetical protein
VAGLALLSKSADGLEAARTAAFYAVGTLLLVAIWSTWLVNVSWLSDEQAHRIGHNSEGYLFALLLCAWIQWVLPWAEERGLTRIVSIAGGAASVVIGLWLKNGPLPVQYATLNEAMFGLAFVLVYLALFRWHRLAPLFSLAVVVGLLLGSNTGLVEGAEYWLVLVLAPLSFSVFDRTITDPDAEESHVLRLAWMSVLIAVPVLVIALGGDLSENAEGIPAYLARANEAFLGLLIVHAYFGYWMRGARLNVTSKHIGQQALPASAHSMKREGPSRR